MLRADRSFAAMTASKKFRGPVVATDEEHPLIAFAGKFGDPLFDYLNAGVAFARAEDLLRDAYDLSAILEANSPEDRRWYPWFGAEIVSYYAIGYVTCLEWHAKSRLVDLLNFQPSSLRVTDVQKTITDKLIVQMVSKQASVTQLVGAALKVGNLETYFSVVGRVFRELGIPCSVTEWLTGSSPDANVCWLKNEQLANLSRLFEFRHMLVHELGIATMGHPNVRDAWAPDDAKINGQQVASLICGVEAALTRYAPRLFPNLLNETRSPIDAVETMTDEVNRLDTKIDTAVRGWEWNDDQTAAAWQMAREKFADYCAAEQHFISTAGLLHWRYFDARTPLRLRVLRYRLGFLEELGSHLATALDDNPDATASV